jgi:hypothetical protein
LASLFLVTLLISILGFILANLYSFSYESLSVAANT